MSLKQAWVCFWLLALVWGSSSLFIRLGVNEVLPMQVVFIRTAIASVGLLLTMAWRKTPLPLNKQTIIDLLFLGLANTVLPFALITWGNSRIDSGLATIWQGTSALFSLVIAHFLFTDERITTRKALGLLLGFGGMLVLGSRSLMHVGVAVDLWGQLAIVGASLCYAVGGIYSRKAMQVRIEPLAVSAGSMTVAAIASGLIVYIAPFFGGQSPVALSALSGMAISALLILGLLHTFLAYAVFYAVIVVLGATRTSMVTYITPVIAIILGVVFLNEILDARLILGMVMILSGVSIATLSLHFGKQAKAEVSA
jgi:drug/metabolite transporter (DMT)-like permease